MTHYVFECQTQDGTGTAIPMAYATKEEAEQHYHEVLAAAAVSPVEQHGAIIISADFRYIRREIYDKTTGEVEETSGDEVNGV